MADRPPPGTILRGRCPRCGEGKLFAGVVRFADRCGECGLDFGRYNVGDGAAAFLILLVGAILTSGAIWLELAYSPPFWVHAIWIPIGFGLTLGGLRLGKAFFLTQEYAHDAREGRLSE